MSAIERVLNRLEEKILVSSEEVTGQSQGTPQGESMGCVIGGASLKQPALQGESR